VHTPAISTARPAQRAVVRRLQGEFMLADRRYCYPLTITDFASRYLFACEALATTKEAYAFPVFEAVSATSAPMLRACLGPP
jgi:hypothetical protein